MNVNGAAWLEIFLLTYLLTCATLISLELLYVLLYVWTRMVADNCITVSDSGRVVDA